MFKSTTQESLSLSPEDRRLLLRADLLLARAAKRSERFTSDEASQDMTLKLKILREFAERLRTGEPRAESQDLSRLAIKSQLMPQISMLLRALGPPKRISAATSSSTQSSQSRPASIESNDVAQGSTPYSMLSSVSKVLGGLALIAQMPLLIGQIIATTIRARLSRKSRSTSSNEQAPLTGASVGSQILDKFRLPQIRWISSLLDYLSGTSIGTVRLGKISTVRDFLPSYPSISLGDKIVPLLDWLENASDSPDYPPLFQKAKDEIFTRRMVPVKRGHTQPVSTDIEISVQVSAGKVDLPFPISHDLSSIFLHGPGGRQIENLEVTTNIFGGIRVTIPPGVSRVTYWGQPSSRDAQLSPETSSLLLSLGHLDPSYDAIDQEYFKALSARSMPLAQRLADCMQNLWASRPRLYCDNAAILKSLATSSQYEMAYLSRIGVCMDFARQVQADCTHSGVPTVLVSSSSLKNNKISPTDHIVIAETTGGRANLIDPTNDSYKLKVPADSVARIASELSRFPRSTPEEIALLAESAYEYLKEFADFKQSLEDKLASTHYTTETLATAIRVVWGRFVSSEPEDRSLLLVSLKRHLARTISMDQGFALEVLEHIERIYPSKVCSLLLERLLEGAKILRKFGVAQEHLPLALRIGTSKAVGLLTTDQKISLTKALLEASTSAPNKLRLAVPSVSNLAVSIAGDSLSENQLKALRETLMLAVNLKDPAAKYLGQEIKAAYEATLTALVTHFAEVIPAIVPELIIDLAQSRAPFCRTLFNALVIGGLTPSFGPLVRRRYIDLMSEDPHEAARLLVSLKSYGVSVGLSPLTRAEKRRAVSGLRRVLRSIPTAAPGSALDRILITLNQPRCADYKARLVESLVHFGLTKSDIAHKLPIRNWKVSNLIDLLSTLKDTQSGPSNTLAAAIGYDLPAALLFYPRTSLRPLRLTREQERAHRAFEELWSEDPAVLDRLIVRVIKREFPELTQLQTDILPHIIVMSRQALLHEQYISLLAVSACKRGALNKFRGMRQVTHAAFTANCSGTKFNPLSIEHQISLMNEDSLLLSIATLPPSLTNKIRDWFGIPKILLDDPEEIKDNPEGGFWTHCFNRSTRQTFAKIFGISRHGLRAPSDPLLVLSGYLGNISIRGPQSRLMGSGELAELREYTPGEPINRLDHRALGRTDKLLVKHYREREAPAAVLLVDLEWLAEEVPRWHTSGAAPRLFELLLRQRSLSEDKRPNRVIFHFRGRPINIESWTDEPYERTGLTSKWWTLDKPQFKDDIPPSDNIVDAAYAVAEYLHAERSIGVDRFPWNQQLAALDAGLDNFPSQTTIYLLNTPQNLDYTGIFVAAAQRKGAKIVRWRRAR